MAEVWPAASCAHRWPFTEVNPHLVPVAVRGWRGLQLPLAARQGCVDPGVANGGCTSSRLCCCPRNLHHSVSVCSGEHSAVLYTDWLCCRSSRTHASQADRSTLSGQRCRISAVHAGWIWLLGGNAEFVPHTPAGNDELLRAIHG